MTEALGTVHMRRRGLLQGWWWPVGPKLVFNLMAAPLPKIMDECDVTLFRPENKLETSLKQAASRALAGVSTFLHNIG
jgi:hypothetical protein